MGISKSPLTGQSFNRGGFLFVLWHMVVCNSIFAVLNSVHEIMGKTVY